MLQIIVPETSLFDEASNEFIDTKEQALQLEHSLVSLSKWESKWKKPFLSKDSKTMEESIDYIRCMTLTRNIDPNIYKCLSNENILAVNEYIADSMTATWFGEKRKKTGLNRKQITAELIYYWMIALNMQIDVFEKWHLNRLLTLIEVCNEENQPPKKIGKKALMSRNAALNASRRRQMNSRG